MARRRRRKARLRPTIWPTLSTAPIRHSGQRQRQPRPGYAAAERLVRRPRRPHGRHGRRRSRRPGRHGRPGGHERRGRRRRRRRSGRRTRRSRRWTRRGRAVGRPAAVPAVRAAASADRAVASADAAVRAAVAARRSRWRSRCRTRRPHGARRRGVFRQRRAGTGACSTTATRPSRWIIRRWMRAATPSTDRIRPSRRTPRRAPT